MQGISRAFDSSCALWLPMKERIRMWWNLRGGKSRDKGILRIQTNLNMLFETCKSILYHYFWNSSHIKHGQIYKSSSLNLKTFTLVGLCFPQRSNIFKILFIDISCLRKLSIDFLPFPKSAGGRIISFRSMQITASQTLFTQWG